MVYSPSMVEGEGRKPDEFPADQMQIGSSRSPHHGPNTALQTPPVPPPSEPNHGSGNGSKLLTITLVVVAMLVVGATATLVVWAVGRGDGSGSVTAGPVGSDRTDRSDSATTSRDRTSDDREEQRTTSTIRAEDPTTTTEPVEIPEELRVVTFNSSNIRGPVNLACPPKPRSTYGPELLVDGDENTGWGASKHDGTGEWIDLGFGGPVRVARIGITAGFNRFAPRKDQDCRSVHAFPFNRRVTAFRYTFDDGRTLVHDMADQSEMQYIELDPPATTSSVRITIEGTYRPPGADDDTIISEAMFEGYR